MSPLRHVPAAGVRGLVWVILVALASPACRVTDVPLWGPPELPDAVPVERIPGIAYYNGPGADPLRHRLDLFLPRGRKDFPVVMFVHGSAWVVGDNRCCGLYSSVGEFLAGQGIGAVLPNYRLSPEVKHPEHVKDVARAFAWTKAHIAEYGGRPDQLFLAGHSAGGHLVALLVTDEKYLKAEGLRTRDVKGVILISGVYHIPDKDPVLALGGNTARGVRFDEVVPVRGGTMWGADELPFAPGIPLPLKLYDWVFGSDPKVRADASPTNHVRPGLPPFLIFTAAKDFPTLPESAAEFDEALRGQGDEVQLLKIADRNHHSIVFQAVRPDDPVARAMLEFIDRHLGSASEDVFPRPSPSAKILMPSSGS
jgi:acetyl esterase/lipase